MGIDIKEIKELAQRFSPDQIDQCISQQLETGVNVCLRNQPADEIVNELAKAEFIKRLMSEGMCLGDALRELARRMRNIQKGVPGE